MLPIVILILAGTLGSEVAGRTILAQPREPEANLEDIVIIDETERQPQSVKPKAKRARK